jgi:hypothetical protein
MATKPITDDCHAKTTLACLLLCVALPLSAQSPVVSSVSVSPSAEELAQLPRDEHVLFGASVGIAGRTAMAANPQLGSVAVFTLTKEGGWSRTSTLVQSGGSLGRAIDLDTNSAVITGALERNGAVISSLNLFRRMGREWREIARAELGSPQLGFRSGVEHENGVIAVSVSRIDVFPSPDPGAVYIYELARMRNKDEAHAGSAHSKLRLRRTAILQANDGFPDDGFGTSLAMEGPLLVVGARDAVYVFLHAGPEWIQIARLTSSDGQGIGFGASVDIHKGVILVGAPGADVPSDLPLSSEGNAYVFLPTREGWIESQKLNGGESLFFSEFGSKVAMGDGLVAVSAPRDQSVLRGVGRIIVFDWVGDQLQFGRSVTDIEGTAGTDLDMSGRQFIAGMMPTTAFVERAVGRAEIFRFGRSPDPTASEGLSIEEAPE